MVQEANVKRAQAEKALAESEMKVDGLETEVSALKALVITSTPSQPNKHLSVAQSHHRATADQSDSAPSSPSRSRADVDATDGGCGDSERNIDPTLRQDVTGRRADLVLPEALVRVVLRAGSLKGVNRGCPFQTRGLE